MTIRCPDCGSTDIYDEGLEEGEYECGACGGDFMTEEEE